MKTTALVGLLLAATIAPAAEVTNYSLETHFAYGQSRSADGSMQSIVRLTPGFDVEFSPRTRAVVEARIRIDFADELEPGELDTETYSTLSRPASISDLGSAELRDAYIERAFDNGVLRLGKQQIVWGRLDGIKVTDVLNPQDFREFILQDFGDSRISLWSAYLDLSFGVWRTEFALLSDNTGHAIPARGAWFELTAPRYRYGANASDPSPLIVTNRESISTATAAYALRLTRQFGNAELGALLYSGTDHEPLGRILDLNGTPAVERYYERRDLVGLHAETAIGGLALRAEVALQPDRVFNTRSGTGLATTTRDQLTAGIGIDIDGPWDTFINVQHVYDNVRSAPVELVRPGSDRITTLFVRRTFSYESTNLTGRYFHSHDLGDDMLTLALEWQLGDATSLRLGADWFDGDKTGVFGQFADRDRVVLSLTHTF